MLSRQERLTKNREFAYIYRKKKSVANSYIILYVGNKKTDQNMPTKAGFVVGKKVHKKAVKRNRIKRQLRESYKSISKSENFLLRDYDKLIFIARPAIVELDYHQIYNAMRDCINKAGRKYGT